MARYRAETLERIRVEREQRTGRMRLEAGGWETLPEELFALDWLTEFDASGASLVALPEDFGQRFPMLRELLLFDNQLTTLPDSVCSLRALEVLDVSLNQLTELPERLGALTSLRRFYAGNNQLASLPASLGALVQLEQLRLEDNALESLPVELAQLRALASNRGRDFERGLQLQGNRFRGVPASVFSLDPAAIIASLLTVQAGEALPASVTREANAAAQSVGLALADRFRNRSCRNARAASLVAKVRASPLRDSPEGSIARWLREDLDEDFAALLAALVFHRPRYVREGDFELYAEPQARRGLVVVGQDYYQREVAFDPASPSYSTRFVLLDPEEDADREAMRSWGAVLEYDVNRERDEP